MARRVAREEYEQLCRMIKKWNENRLELFEITMPNENLEFEGIMRFYFQSTTREAQQKVATKCIRVSNTANTNSVIEALVQKFRPDLRMLTNQSSYALYEVHSNEEERRMEMDEYPLMVQLDWVNGEREGRFLLRRETENGKEEDRRKRISKRGKKVKKEKEGVLEEVDARGRIARSLYNVMPESKFTRSISKKIGHNPSSLHGSRDFLDDNSTLRVYANSLLPNGPCKSLLISAHDTAAQVVKSSLEKYGVTDDPNEFCLVQVTVPPERPNGSSPQLNMEYAEHILGDNERPLQISSQWRGGGRGDTVQFHLRRKDSFIHRPHSASHSRSRSQSPDEADDPTLPALVEIFLDTHNPQRPRRFLLSVESTEIGSSAAFAAGNPDRRGHLCLSSPSIKPRHCAIKSDGRAYTITPLDKSAMIFVNSNPIHSCQVLDHNSVVRLGDHQLYRFFAPIHPHSASVTTAAWQNHSNHKTYESGSLRGDVSRAKSVENIRNTSLVGENHQVTASRRLREKAFSEYDLQAQMEEEEDEGGGGDERKTGERKRSEPHSAMEERYASPKKRHLSAPLGPGIGPLPGNNSQLETDQEWVTPISLSFHQTKQQLLLKKMVAEVNTYQLQFKLGPAYGLYMVVKYIFSPEFQPGSSVSERRKNMINGLKSISSHIKRTVKENRSDAGALAFWLANTTEFLHFLRQDYQLGQLSNDYDVTYTNIIHLVYKYFVQCMIKELQVFLPAFYDDSSEADDEDSPAGYTSGPENVTNRVGKEPDVIPTANSKVSRHTSVSGYYTVTGSKVARRGRSTIHDVLQTLNSTITLLKRCRVNATLSIMIFSNLFRYISVKVFNRLVGGEVKHCGRSVGQRLCRRLGKVKAWAEREGMELPAETHLTMIVQAANLLQASKKHSDNSQAICSTCSNLNTLQVSTLLEFCVATDGEATLNKTLVDDLLHSAGVRDEVLCGDGVEVRLEEDIHPELLFHIPVDGYSSELVTGIPAGLQEFLQPMISAGLCKLTVSKESSGMWSPPVRNVTSSQSMDHSTSPQHTESPHTFNTLPKASSRSHKSSADNELNHNTLPRHGNPADDLRVLKLVIAKENILLGISIVGAKLPSNTHMSGETAIFIKSMVDGGSAQLDGRLKPGDQIMEVDGIDFSGFTQDRASLVLRNTGKKVTLVVAKQAAQYYGMSHVIQQSSPRYNRNTPEGSSHARKAARRLKREQKERQRQDRYTTEFRLERKKLDHHAEHTTHPSTSDPRFPPNTNPQLSKWIMEQNTIYNSDKGSEIERPGSTSSLSNIADQDGRTSPVPSFATSSSRRTKSSFEKYSHRTGSPPVRDTSGPSSRQHDAHSASPFDTLESLDTRTMSDSASKFSDYSAEPEYSSPPPKSAPPASVIPHMSYKDAFITSLNSQQMSNSLTSYSQQQIPSQTGHLDKLSMDVMYHTQQSGASLSGISSIVPQLLQGKGGRPYLGKVHLKELDGDEIDLEKQRIKLMFYEKKNEERALREEEETSPDQETAVGPARQAYASSSSPDEQQQQFQMLEKEREMVLSDDDGVQMPKTKELLQELDTLEQATSEQRRMCKDLKYARERESLKLKRAEVEFQEQELLEPDMGGAMSVSAIHQERWQKEQKRRLRQLERFRGEQKDKIQTIEVEEHRAKAKLKAYQASLLDLKQRLDAMISELSSVPNLVPPQVPPQVPGGESSRVNGISPTFTGELHHRDDQHFMPIDSDPAMPPEREWPKDANPKSNPGRFISMESINSSSLVGGNEPPEFSRELVNTISESTNMTEPTQDEAVTARWNSKYVTESDDPYADEFSSKFSYSDYEFFMDDRRTKLEPVDARPFNLTSEKDLQRPAYPHDGHPSMRSPNGHINSYHNHHRLNGGGAVDDEEDSDDGRLQQFGQRRKLPASEKLQNYASGRTDHHYSRSNRPRLHNRNHVHTGDNMSTVSGVSVASSRAHTDLLTSDTFKPSISNIAPDVLPGDSSFTATGNISPPTKLPAQLATDSPPGRSLDHILAPHSPSNAAPTSYPLYREHPSPQPVYSTPTNISAVYDVPRKSKPNAVATIYDQPRPTPSSPKNHVPTSSSTSPQPSHTKTDLKHTSYHSKPQEWTNPAHFNSHEQHYDVPKQVSEQNRSTIMSSDRDIARQTAANSSVSPYQYHGLPTKPLPPRSYSRGRHQDSLGYSGDRGFRGQMTRPSHPRVQRQQTEL